MLQLMLNLSASDDIINLKTLLQLEEETKVQYFSNKRKATQGFNCTSSPNPHDILCCLH